VTSDRRPHMHSLPEARSLAADRRLRVVLPDLFRGRHLWRQLGPPARPIRSCHPRDITFDVFDTVLGRLNIDTASLWADEAKASIPEANSAEVDHLSRVRKVAQQRAQAQTNNCATLEEIHREVARELQWPLTRCFNSAMIEIEIERRVSIPLPRGLEMLTLAREQTRRVIFVSDMYLPSFAIRDLLVKGGCWNDGDILWVSAAARARKRTGALYERVLDHEGLSASSTTHVGDDLLADRVVPRWLGIGSIHLPAVASTCGKNA